MSGDLGQGAKFLEVVGLPLLESASLRRLSLPTDVGSRDVSEKLWGRCGPEPRAPLAFSSGAC